MNNRKGYADFATQEEAERLSKGKYQTGIVVFIPVDGDASEVDINEIVVILKRMKVKKTGGEK